MRRNDNYSIVLVDIATQSIKWEKTFQKREGKLSIRSLIINNEHFLLQQKGRSIYFYSAKDGLMLWEKTLESDKSKLAIHNNKLIYYSQNNPFITIVDPLSKKQIGEYTLDSPVYWWHRFDDNIIMETKKSLTSIKTYKPFLRGIHNWSVILEDDEVFQRVGMLGNNIFALTSQYNLYCINKKSGKVININSLDVFGDVEIYSHTPDQPLVLHIDDFLIGIDPHHGKSVWKIREKDIDDWDDLVAFANNKLFVIKQTHQSEPGMVDIMAYNQTTGDLLWQSNELLYTECNNNCDYSLHNFENSSIYIKTSHKSNNNYAPKDALYMLNLDWKPDKNYIPKDNLYNQLASCYIKSGDFDKAEDLLTQIVWNIDQQNEQAYSQLSNMYLTNNNIKNYISTLSNYYDLVKYDNTKKMQL